MSRTNPESPPTDIVERVRQLVSTICDPEIPVLTIEDLGMLREVSLRPNGDIRIDITPTYSGCPAMDAIQQSIEQTLAEANIRNCVVNLVLTPAWTTDWMTESGLAKLKAYGIAPPRPAASMCQPTDLPDHRHSLSVPLFVLHDVACPRCDSTNTHRVSAFGSTACKEHWLCKDCKEPFDHFKCH